MSEEKTKETNTSGEAKNEWSKRELGALWLRQGKSQKYLSGYVESDDLGFDKKRIIVFKKLNKPNDRAPDYVIYESDESYGSPKKESEAQKPSKETSKEIPENTEDDIPAF